MDSKCLPRFTSSSSSSSSGFEFLVHVVRVVDWELGRGKVDYEPGNVMWFVGL